MNAVTARELARHTDGRFGEQEHTRPEVTLPRNINVSTWGTWDEEGFYAVDVEDVGLQYLSPSEQIRVNQIVHTWFDGTRELDPPAPVGVHRIVASMQPVLRRDALQWYVDTVRDREDTFDDEISFYGADGPLGVRNEDGTITLVDGNHRFAAAMLRGDTTFTMQVLEAP